MLGKRRFVSRTAEDRQDVIFRKVRGILNKITPETFDKLSKELVNVGLDSPRTLRGVIYLLFDKALKDLKYSSLYAKLCQELSEKAPNFEVEPGPNTFCKFLISKCEDEFERRRRATEDFDRKNDLTDEEYEQRAIAKQKMLGNIKFICELGKKRLLQEEILHECIRGLLSKKKERSIQDQAQDLECLCQIMRTIGSLLDIQASRNLMNQYFERIDMFSKKPELPSRIRFMLRDVIDLRNNNWRPRPFQREDNIPQPLSKLREEAGYDPNTSSSVDKFGNNRNLIGISDLSKLHGNKLSLLLDDEPSFTTSTDFHWGPSFLSLENPFDPFSMGGTTNKVTQKPSTTPAVIAPISSQKRNAHANENNSNFGVNDLLTEHGSDRRLDSRPGLMRHNMINSQRAANDPGRFKEGSIVGRRQHADMITSRDVDPHPSFRSRPSGFALYNVPNTEHEECGIENGPRRNIEPRPEQQPTRVPHAQQMNRSINRRQDFRESAPPPVPEIQPTVHLSQSRSNSRHVAARNPSPIMSDDQSFRDRRPLQQENYREQNSRFSNNYRPPRSERHKARENIQYERSMNESDTSQNWRAGPSSSASSVTSKHSSNPPSKNEIQPIRKPKPGLAESDSQERQTYGRSRNLEASEVTNIDSNRAPSMQPQIIDKQAPPMSNIIRNYSDRPESRRYPNKDDISSNLINEQQADHINRPIQRSNVDTNRPTNVGRRLNISPPRSRNIDPVPRHQLSTQKALGPPAVPHAHQNLQTNRSVSPGAQNPSNLQASNQSHRKFIPNDISKSQSLKGVGTNDIGPPTNDRRLKPLSRSNNPSISSDIQDSDRVSNWRKAGGLNVAPQPTAKSSTKEQIKPQLSTSILPKPLLPKISDTNFSLRPSHNLISSRGPFGSSKPSAPTDDEPIPTRTAPQTNTGVNKTSAEGKIESAGCNNPCTEQPSTNGSSDKETHNKSARDFHVNKFISALSEHSDEENVSRIASKVRELKIPKNYQTDCLVTIIRQSIFKTEADRENIKKLMIQLLPNTFEPTALSSAFKIIFEQLQALEAEIPKVKSLVAGFLSQAILDGLSSLEEVGSVLNGGRHHPLFLLCLQKLENSAGQAWLSEKFINSKIDLMTMLPEVDRSKDRLASILKDRCLGFLDPMLTIEPDLLDQMRDKGTSPTTIYRWIKENVSTTILGTPIFAHVLVNCLVTYIHSASEEKIKLSESSGDRGEDASQSNKSSPSSASQASADMEKELLSKYQQMLQAILKDSHMQLAALYSLQSFYHRLDFPKGALLRWFHQMYDLNIVDDDVFTTWKEEINDKFPGKGQALFQVNTWLNWLAAPDSDEEEEV